MLTTLLDFLRPLDNETKVMIVIILAVCFVAGWATACTAVVGVARAITGHYPPSFYTVHAVASDEEDDANEGLEQKD